MKIWQIQSIMVSVSTGEAQIQEMEDEYIQLYLDIENEIEILAKTGLSLRHSNSFRTLWDWYGYWSSRLPSYDSRRKYVQDLYAPLVNTIESALHKHRVDETPLEDLIGDLAKGIGTQPEVDRQGFRIVTHARRPDLDLCKQIGKEGVIRNRGGRG